MTFMPPEAARNAVPAEWVTSRIDVFAEQWVSGMVGPDFQAYARIFHPMDDEPDAPRWADVARSQGRVMHAGAQWGQINPAPAELGDGRSFPGEPRTGHLYVEALTALCAILTRHTETPARTWFAVWDGWGWEHPGGTAVLRSSNSGEPLAPLEMAPEEWQLDLTGPTFALPGRVYRLFGGAVDAATRIGHWVAADWFDPQSPSIFWPEDHRWCVATEVDADSTLVGGSRELIEEVINSPLLEALPIARDALRLDTINPW